MQKDEYAKVFGEYLKSLLEEKVVQMGTDGTDNSL